MKFALLGIAFLLSCGCLTPPRPRSWDFKDLARGQSQTHHLQDSTGFGFHVSTDTIRDVILVYDRLTDAIKHIVEINAELMIVESDDADAFVGWRNGKPVIGITAPMMILIGNDVDLYAALLGHEVAHLAWGHLQDIQKRKRILNAIGVALSGTPAAIAAPIGLAAINAVYTRDEEREADALGVEMMIAAQFDPNAAIRFHELLRQYAFDVSSFIATHPPSDERIQNIKRIIDANKSKR